MPSITNNRCTGENQDRSPCKRHDTELFAGKWLCPEHLGGIVTYQLEKVDQGGAIMDHFEEQVHMLAHEWGLKLNEEMELILPGGRVAGLHFTAYIETPDPKDKDRLTPQED